MGCLLSVEASKTSLCFCTIAARYKVIREEISLHWASFESKQPYIMNSSDIDHGAEDSRSHRALSHRGGKLLNVCETTCLGTGAGE